MVSSETSQQPPMRALEPRPMASPSANAPYFPPPPGSGLASNPGPESRHSDHHGSAMAVPTVPGHTLTPMVPPVPADVRNIKASAQYHLREYLSTREKLRRQGGDGGSSSRYDLDAHLRAQTGLTLGNLSTLQAEIRALAKSAERARWSRLLGGGAIAMFIPIVRKFFRRGSDEESQLSSNDTEHAFRKSKSLLAGVKNAILGGGAFAKVAMFVFAVLFVFQNEVTIRVAKTLNKRLKNLTERVERGDQDLTESDLRVFQGWRWRVLLW